MTLQLSNNPQSLDFGGAVDSFLQSFFAVKSQKNMEKYRKLQPQIDLINHIVSDEDTPWDSKMKAVDTLQHVLGIKSDDGISLSRHIFGNLTEQMVKTGETAAQPGTPSKTGETIQAPT